MSACDDRDPEACWDCGAKDGLMPCRYCWNCQREEFEWRVKEARENALKEAAEVCDEIAQAAQYGNSRPTQIALGATQCARNIRVLGTDSKKEGVQ